MHQTLLLELALQRGLGLPAGVSVFAVRRHDEPYAPPIPLVLCGGLHAPLLDVLLELDVLARPIYQVHALPAASPPPAVNFALLGPGVDPHARAAEAARLLSALQAGGVARIALTPELRETIARATAASHDFFANGAINASARWERIGGTARSERGAGHVDGAAREYLQVRRALAEGARSGALSAVVPAATPPQIARLFCELEQASVVVLAALALALARDEQAFAGVLDAPFGPVDSASGSGSSPDGPVESASASVLRCYLYKPCAARGAALQGAHADLGLLTLSPLSSVPTLEAWDHERLGWSPVEREAHAAGGCDALVFAGETLSLLSAGQVPAVLHKVDMRGAGLHDVERVSMPFFLRARPDARLRAIGSPGAQLPLGSGGADVAAGTTAEFMSRFLFARRPWRAPAAGGKIADY